VEKDRSVISKLIDEEKSHIRRLLTLKSELGLS